MCECILSWNVNQTTKFRLEINTRPEITFCLLIFSVFMYDIEGLICTESSITNLLLANSILPPRRALSPLHKDLQIMTSQVTDLQAYHSPVIKPFTYQTAYH